MKTFNIKLTDRQAREYDYYLSKKYGKRKSLETKLKLVVMTEIASLAKQDVDEALTKFSNKNIFDNEINNMRKDFEKLIFELEEEFKFGWGRANSIVDDIIKIWGRASSIIDDIIKIIKE